MTIAWLALLILGIIGIVMAFKAQSMEYRTATFWFLAAFWIWLVLQPFSAHVALG